MAEEVISDWRELPVHASPGLIDTGTCPLHHQPAATITWGAYLRGLPDRWKSVRFGCGCVLTAGNRD